MGFTIYWQAVHPVSQAVWDTFVTRALKLVKRKRTGEIELEYKPANLKNILRFRGSEEEQHETFSVSKDSLNENGWGSCKTAEKPYTMDVYICLILMFDLGMLKRFSSDNMSVMYPEALEYVKQHYALNRSYAKLVAMGQFGEDGEEAYVSPLSQRPRKTRKAKAAKRAKTGKRAKTAKRASK